MDKLPVGLDEILERGAADYQARHPPTMLSALATLIDPTHRGRGISAEVIYSLRQSLRVHGFVALAAPVRPSLKNRYPLISVAQYLA